MGAYGQILLSVNKNPNIDLEIKKSARFPAPERLDFD
jgi:hypothetical protein